MSHYVTSVIVELILMNFLLWFLVFIYLIAKTIKNVISDVLYQVSDSGVLVHYDVPRDRRQSPKLAISIV